MVYLFRPNTVHHLYTPIALGFCTRKAVVGINRRQTYAVRCNCLEMPEMHVLACRTVTISQSLFANRFTNWNFSLSNKLNLAFLKAFGSENYRLALSVEKHLATVFAKSSKLGK